MAGRVRSYIGLGANLGDPGRTLADAVHALAALPGARLRGVSRLFATEPWGVEDQPEFRNAVVALDLDRRLEPQDAAMALLVDLKDLERAFGRRPADRWGPREVDLDILVFGRHRLSTERRPEARSIDAGTDASKAGRWLVVPHPEMAERLFVLAPLADLAPRLVPPGWATTVETARRRREAIEGPAAARPIGSWDAHLGRWVTAGD